MSLFTRARRHVDMNRVKALREEKIKEEKIAEVRKQQEEILAELKEIEIKENPKYSNWRREINEQMTTADMGMVNYAAVGDVNLGAAMADISLSGPSGHGYNAITQSSTSSYKQFDTMVVTISTTSSDWVIEPGDVIIGLAQGGAGTHTIVIPRTYSSLYFSAKDDGTFSASVQYQRRSPVNLVVPLDDPEANSFIRGGLGGDKDRRQKLKEMLEAGNQWMYIRGLEPSKTSPGDIELDTVDTGKDYGEIAGGLTGPRNYPGEGVPRDSPRGPYTPLKNYGTDKNPKFMPSGPSQNPWRLA